MKRLVILTALVALSALWAAAETIYVNGNKITGTTTLSTGGGTVSYNASTKVLTINNVTCDRSGSDNNGIDCKNVTDLVINMSGTNSLKANNASAVVCGGNVLINIESGTTSFISTAGSQNAIGLYDAKVTLRGAGTLNLRSDNGPAIQGREGSCQVTIETPHCYITSTRNDIYNLDMLTINQSTNWTVKRGLKSSIYVHFAAHSNANYAHAANISNYRRTGYATIKRPVMMVISELENIDYATQEIEITDEAIDSANFVAIGDCLYSLSSGSEASLVGPIMSVKYTGQTIQVPGFVTLSGKMLPVRVEAEAFEGLRNLTTVKVCWGATALGDRAFANCPKLTGLNLPGSLTSLGANMILGSKVNNIYWTTQTGANLETTTFFNNSTTKGTLYLPNDYALSRITSTAITKYFNTKVVSGCNDASVTADGITYAYLYSKAATATSHGEMTLIGITSSKSNQTVTFNEGSDLSRRTYTAANGGDGRIYDLTTIATSAFAANTKLTAASLMASTIKTIGENAFNGCSALQTLGVGRGMEKIANNAFEGCSKLATLQWDAAACSDFNVCPLTAAATSLTTVTVGNAVTKIPAGLLVKSTAIRTVNWGAAEYIDPTSSPFSASRTHISQLNILDGVKRIPANLCKGFEALRSLTLPATVTVIGEAAFRESGLTSALLGNVVTIGANAFRSTPLKNVVLPPSLTTLEHDAFNGCTRLETVTNTSSITEVRDNTFDGCTALKSINIPDGVAAIGTRAFMHCESLESLELPLSVTALGSEALGYCLALKDLSSYPASSDITMGNAVFNQVDKTVCKLHVRPSCLAAYKVADQWKEFFDNGNIVGDLEDGYSRYDVNFDHNVDVGDVNAVLADILAGGTTPTYDVNDDNAVDVGDVNAILAAILEQ